MIARTPLLGFLGLAITVLARMAPPSSFRAVYKVVDDQEIEVDVYLPQSGTEKTGVDYPISTCRCDPRSPCANHLRPVINIHGGAFMLGSSDMVNKDQIQDCLNRGWIVIAPNHRLCPQVDLLDGPMRDCRDLLDWIHSGGLHSAVSSETSLAYPLDLDHVFAFGTSSGGTLALSLVRLISSVLVTRN
jgi:acetyl esterase/lipase